MTFVERNNLLFTPESTTALIHLLAGGFTVHQIVVGSLKSWAICGTLEAYIIDSHLFKQNWNNNLFYR